MTAGRVTVNGVVVSELGARVDPLLDAVTVDGVEVRIDAGPVYLMLHKPSGYISTMSDPHARHTVAELVPTDKYPGLFPVGRLDADTTGLLLFTTDGEFAHRILHPKQGVFKTYIAHVERILRDGELQWLRDGVMLDDGMTAPAYIERIETLDDCDPAIDVLSISLSEGRKRQVRRMCETVGHPVRDLKRIAFGAVELGDLAQGSVRALTSTERDALRRSVALS